MIYLAGFRSLRRCVWETVYASAIVTNYYWTLIILWRTTCAPVTWRSF